MCVSKVHSTHGRQSCVCVLVKSTLLTVDSLVCVCVFVCVSKVHSNHGRQSCVCVSKVHSTHGRPSCVCVCVLVKSTLLTVDRLVC